MSWVEVDVRRTADDVLVVAHDAAYEDGAFLVDLSAEQVRSRGTLAAGRSAGRPAEGAGVEPGPQDVHGGRRPACGTHDRGPAGRRSRRGRRPAPAVGELVRPGRADDRAASAARRSPRAAHLARLPDRARRRRRRAPRRAGAGAAGRVAVAGAAPEPVPDPVRAAGPPATGPRALAAAPLRSRARRVVPAAAARPAAGHRRGRRAHLGRRPPDGARAAAGGRAAPTPSGACRRARCPPRGRPRRTA